MPNLNLTSSGQSGNDFNTELNSSLGASWASQFDDSTMTTSTTVTSPAPKKHAPADNITPGQRMISATAGNVLTGLLGESTSSGLLEPQHAS
jgi:solute carrier family 25 protein 39/40